MSPAGSRTAVEIEGRELSLSNLDKVLYPEVGFTKAEVIDYYRRIAPVMVPHLTGRPITLKRYPDGVEGQFFFERRTAHRTGRRGSGRSRSRAMGGVQDATAPSASVTA